MTSLEHNDNSSNVFLFQQRALAILTGWAAGSMAAGWLWWQSGGAWWRGLGSQFAGWGIIDAIIAAFGLRSASRNAARLASGDMDQLEQERQAQNFERLLWINSALDVGYVLAGGWLTKRHADDEGRRGIGWGIVIQGTFLLIFDLTLAWLMRVRRRAG